jgi:hypothetical protein
MDELSRRRIEYGRTKLGVSLISHQVYPVAIGEPILVPGRRGIHKVAAWFEVPRIYGVGKVARPDLRATTTCGLETERLRRRSPIEGTACPVCWPNGYRSPHFYRGLVLHTDNTKNPNWPEF